MDNSQASASGSTSAVKKDYTNSDVVSVKQTNRNPEVWCNYDLCIMNDGALKARCKKCGNFYAASANTTLLRHKNSSCRAVSQDSSQANIGSDGRVFIYDQEALRQDFTKFVIRQTLPFNHFDNAHLTEIIKQRLQPRYQPVSRTTLRSDAFKLWERAKHEIIEGFQNYKYGVSITSDVWTAPSGTANSFLALTAHWFHPDSWLLMKRTIAFKIFAYPHNGNNIRKILHDTLKEYNLDDKVFTISLDNASNNNRGMDLLKCRIKPILDGAFFHSRCVAHVINLAVQSALKICDSLRMLFRNLLQTIYSSSNERQMNYRRFRKQCGEVPLGPCYDNNTRWNSTCLMFQNILRQRQTLNTFNEGLVARNKSVSIDDEDWEKLSELTSFLQVFKEATTLLSGVYYPTSSLVLNQLYLMTFKLNEYESHRTPMFRKMVRNIRNKFIKYYHTIPLVFTCSAALNPCLNVGGVEYLIRNIMENLGLQDGMDPENADYEFIPRELFKFNDTFTKLFEIYATKHGQRQNPIVDPFRAGSSSSRMSSDIQINLYNSLREDASKRQRSSAPTSELGNYIGQGGNFVMTLSPEEFANFDILAYWKEKEPNYPILAAMARDLLSVQASTVASESAFSVSGRIISDRRTRLTPEAVEVCVCLKDYLDGVDRIQNEVSLEGPILQDVEEVIGIEEVDLGISPPTTELDEGEFEDVDPESINVYGMLNDDFDDA